MPFSSDFTSRNLVGSQTTAGAAEESVLLSLDGAVGAATIGVTAGTTISVSQILTTAAADASWAFQRSTDAGATWITCAFLNTDVSVDTFRQVTLSQPVVIVGGTAVLIRMRVTTPGGAAAVTCSFGIVQEP
jgi:hypothetical protein